MQDDQVTDTKGLSFAGPQSFDELESEDLYTKYKVYVDVDIYAINVEMILIKKYLYYLYFQTDYNMMY